MLRCLINGILEEQDLKNHKDLRSTHSKSTHVQDIYKKQRNNRRQAVVPFCFTILHTQVPHPYC